MSHQIGMFEAAQEALEIRDSFPGSWLVLSLTQPWATALVTGIKKVETRGWRTNHRGQLYIHASKAFPRYARDFALQHGFAPATLPLGCVIGSVELVDVKRTQEMQALDPAERIWGDYSGRRFAWITTNPKPLSEPIPAIGQLGLWAFRPQGGVQTSEVIA